MSCEIVIIGGAMFHILVNQRGCCDYCGLPKQFFDLYPHCASESKESQSTDTQQLKQAIALVRKEAITFASTTLYNQLDGALVMVEQHACV
jgi:hypothetical protein